MVLSPNDEEVANSSKKHTQFKTWVHKPYPISDQNGRNWYPVSDQNGWETTDTLWRRTYPYRLYKELPPGRKTRCRLWFSLLTQVRLKILGWLPPEKLGGVRGMLPETLTLFQTKICNFPYPLFQTWSKLWYPFSWSLARDWSTWQAVMARTR